VYLWDFAGFGFMLCRCPSWCRSILFVPGQLVGY